MTISTDFGTADNLPVDITIPGYRLRRQVGSDAIGLWFDAEQESLGRKVTIKVLKPEYEHHEGARREFLGEMDRLAPLAHPNLLRILDSARGDRLLLVTERIGQRSLQTMLADGKPLGEEASFQQAHDVARALEYLYRKGLAHKNVSPRLITLIEDGGSRLVTFRNVIPMEDLVALKGKLAQDANYVAPEQLVGPHRIGVKTPSYQVGALLFHMLSGQPAFGHGLPKEIAKLHATEEVPSLQKKRPFLARGIYDFVAACTSRDPEQRPTLEEIIEGLEKLTDGKDPGIRPMGARRVAAPKPRRRRRRR